MKKAILLCGMLLALTATVASAAPGVNLRWQQCLGDGGLLNRNSTCTNSSATNLLEGSFVLPVDVANVSGAEVVVDLASASATLPAWWQFKNIGSCRQASLTLQAHDGPNCPDWAALLASVNIAAYQSPSVYGPNTARILCVNAVDAAGLQNLTALNDVGAPKEYAVFQLSINSAKSAGLGRCDGCATPVCLLFNSLNMTTAGNVANTKIFGPTNGTDSNFATWQGGGVPVVGGRQGCPAATPTKNSTWGSVKALYR